MGDLRERYFATLGIDPQAQGDTNRAKAALDRAYSLRSFEIDLYWRRSAYFWGFQVAIFAAIGFVFQSSAASKSSIVALALSGLGTLTAIANRFSAQGSKFWQKNWEKHIDMLEDKFEGRLHKTVWLDSGGVRYSVSRINEQLTIAFVWFWFFIFAILVANLLFNCFRHSEILENSRFFSVVATILVTFAVLLINKRLRSQLTKLPGSFPNQDGSPGAIFADLPAQVDAQIEDPRRAFIRRNSPDE